MGPPLAGSLIYALCHKHKTWHNIIKQIIIAIIVLSCFCSIHSSASVSPPLLISMRFHIVTESKNKMKTIIWMRCGAMNAIGVNVVDWSVDYDTRRGHFTTCILCFFVRVLSHFFFFFCSSRSGGGGGCFFSISRKCVYQSIFKMYPIIGSTMSRSTLIRYAS